VPAAAPAAAGGGNLPVPIPRACSLLVSAQVNPTPSDLVSSLCLYPHQLVASDFGTLETYLLLFAAVSSRFVFWAGDSAVRLVGRWFDSLAPFVLSDHAVPISPWSCCAFIACSPDAY